MWTREPGLALLIVVAIAACAQVGSKGTMPPAGADGQVDPASAPDFIAVVTGDDSIGYVAKEHLLPSSDGQPGPPQNESWPVYGDDLSTVIGQMVQGRGFVPNGTDPASVPQPPVEVGPSGPPAGADGSMVVYVRNGTTATVWLTMRDGSSLLAMPTGFGAGAAVACLPYVPGAALALSDLPPDAAGGRSWAVTSPDGVGRTVWVDVGQDGALTQGAGVPDWWVDPAQAC